MALKKEVKESIVSKFKRDEKDTGSVEVQVAILTEEINTLTSHMKEHIHDYHSRRGLNKKVNTRKKLLSYLSKHDVQRYRDLVKNLGLRK